LTDGIDDAMSLAYRFLSLFKLLEIRYLSADEEWDYTKVGAALAPYEERYAALKLPRSFFKELCHLRDRCAHIRTGKGSRRALGVTQLNYDALIATEKVLPPARRGLSRSVPPGPLEQGGDLRPWYEKAFEAKRMNPA